MFSMPFAASRLARGIATAITALVFAAILAPAVAVAAPLPAPVLNPMPPDFFTCKPNGGGWTCKAHLIQPYENEPTGIFCGSGTGTFEILDTGTQDIHATRWYDAHGDLVLKRAIYDYPGVHLVNPLTGKTLPYRQHNDNWGILNVPGDPDSEVLYPTGWMIVKAPHMGVVLDIPTYDEYLATGDSALVAKVCKALGA